ncbi:unnamed protein product [Arctia plantaginis]|uniref:Uncharacterized protein n=2 Tax=Arctia plantaginis TaxID=874455 RepID=A0A8S1B9F0_ARCPL|nr:unnamed protein product [Arctia plantaginis]
MWQEWNDYNLRWNDSEYGGVKDLRITPNKLWKPDVLMYNRMIAKIEFVLVYSADEGFDGTYQTNVVVRNNGSCLYVPPGIFKSTCKIDITWFPFDDQHCDMKFGMPGKKNTITYACCPEPYVDVTFTIMIRRRTLYYFFNLIVPCVLISSMALLGFTLPPDSGEKLTLGVTILLSLTVFLNLVAETLPQVSDAIPLLGTYFNCIMFMVASSVVLTVVVLNYHHRTADIHEMPQWVSSLQKAFKMLHLLKQQKLQIVTSEQIKSVFLQWLPWILRMSRPGKKITRKTIMMSNRMRELELKERSSKSLLANVLDIDDDFRHVPPPPNSTASTGNLGPGCSIFRTDFRRSFVRPSTMEDVGGGLGSHHRELHLILRELQFITARMKKADDEAELISDWKFAAMVVDRFCLFVFTLFTIIATVAVLLSAPHIIVQ